ncbi:hypothetical protein F1645_16105 (plasmid) [Novacetimonas hansenii]|uniref:hypothetical protein n=1 Tax=Novacetimonas hansenii TaxID=436 RepID=UPI0009D6B199|nr:hypothetical protein [Novacetimonas hansenii]
MAIAKRSKLTWNELRASGRHGLGYEKIGRSSMKVAIPPFITEETPIIAFRCAGMAPMVGYRGGRVFYVVWIDRAFDVYDHG